MESMIRNIAKVVDKMANEVGKLEEKVKETFDKKAPKSIKNFVKNPSIIFDNYNRKISTKEIAKFIDKKGETVAFSEMLELIVKLKIDNVFDVKNKAKKAKKKTPIKKKTKAKTSRKL